MYVFVSVDLKLHNYNIIKHYTQLLCTFHHQYYRKIITPASNIALTSEVFTRGAFGKKKEFTHYFYYSL
jgi:hypothetical protein